MGLLEDPEFCDEIDIEDPIVDSFYLNTWFRIASTNSEIYEQVFRCLPTDEVFSFDSLPDYAKRIRIAESQPKVAKEILKDVRGHLVLFPTKFLCESSLEPRLMTQEGLAPTLIWT